MGAGGWGTGPSRQCNFGRGREAAQGLQAKCVCAAFAVRGLGAVSGSFLAMHLWTRGKSIASTYDTVRPAVVATGAGGERMKRRGELNLILSAIRQGWDTPHAEREKAMKLVGEVIADPRATVREQMAAFGIVLAAEEVNLRCEQEAGASNDRR